MARIHTHYDNLKVARNAPPEVIRAAYKTLSQKYHPDRNPGCPNAIRIIQMLNLAYEALSDPMKRQEHDEWIDRAEMQGNQTGRKYTFQFANSTERHSLSKPVWRRRHHHKHNSHYGMMFAPLRFVEKARMMLDRFSRYLFKKV